VFINKSAVLPEVPDKPSGRMTGYPEAIRARSPLVGSDPHTSPVLKRFPDIRKSSTHLINAVLGS